MSNTDNEITRYWDILVDEGVATKDELQLVTSINGYSIETLNDVLYTRTGYRDLEQYLDYVGELVNDYVNNEYQG